jgi:hypothetical protein
MGKGYCRPGSQLMDKPFKSRTNQSWFKQEQLYDFKGFYL